VIGMNAASVREYFFNLAMEAIDWLWGVEYGNAKIEQIRDGTIVWFPRTRASKRSKRSISGLYFENVEKN